MTATIRPSGSTGHRSFDPASLSRPAFLQASAVFVLALGTLLVIYHAHVIALNPKPVDLGGGDAVHYHWLARSLMKGEWFTNPIFGLRPPAFPAMIAIIYAISGTSTEIVVFYQLVLGALSTVLAYKIAHLLTDHHDIALLAGGLLAVEAAQVSATVSMMSEPLHNFLLLAGVYWFVRMVRRERWSFAIVSGLLIGLAMLTRPATQYLPILLAVTAIIYQRRLWRHALMLIIVGMSFYGVWSLRNLRYEDNYTFSSSGSFTLLFYRAVAVESHATGVDPEEVGINIKLELEERLGNDVTRADIVDYPIGRPEDLFHNDPDRRAMTTQMALERLRDYPDWWLVMSGVSLVRQFDAAVGLPGTVGLQRLLTGMFILFGALGYVAAWRDRHSLALFLLLTHVLIGYYAGTLSLTHSGLYESRHRTAYMPFILMYTAIGVMSARMALPRGLIFPSRRESLGLDADSPS